MKRRFFLKGLGLVALAPGLLAARPKRWKTVGDASLRSDRTIHHAEIREIGFDQRPLYFTKEDIVKLAFMEGATQVTVEHDEPWTCEVRVDRCATAVQKALNEHGPACVLFKVTHGITIDPYSILLAEGEPNG